MDDFKKLIRERYCKEGIENFSESEVLQLLLSYTCVEDCEKTANYLIGEFGSIKTIFDADINYIIRDGIIDERSAILFKIISSIGRECKKNEINIRCINTPKKVEKYFGKLYYEVDEEMVYTVAVDKKMNILGTFLVSTGSFNSVNADIRKIVDCAIKYNSYGIFISHNHPMASSEPSKSDLVITKNIIKTLHIYDIKLFDHLIKGEDSMQSMKQLGYDIEFDEK